jgi:hypothetical protein
MPFDSWHDLAFGALMAWAWSVWAFEDRCEVIEQ